MPLLSEIIEGVREKEGIRDSGTINDKAAGVFNTAYALGCIIAPILGGYISMYTSFRTTCDVMAFCSMAYAVVFFAIIIMPGVWCKKKEEQNNEEVVGKYENINITTSAAVSRSQSMIMLRQ